MVFLELENKLINLKQGIARLKRLTVSFSGGVDSTLLLKVAKDVLGEEVLAVTAHSLIYPEREFKEAVEIAEQLGVRHVIAELNALEIEGFKENPPDRCYLCKKEVFKKVLEISAQHGIDHVADGSNRDDLLDYRPGAQALKELGVLSPLRDAGLTKADIRALSRELGLPGWDRPAIACLASRFPYGHRITGEKLLMVDHAEQYLNDLGFRQIRVRHHGDIARIEVPAPDRERFFNGDFMDKVHEYLKKLGFLYVTLDLKGYRTGSLNEAIGKSTGNDRSEEDG